MIGKVESELNARLTRAETDAVPASRGNFPVVRRARAEGLAGSRRQVQDGVTGRLLNFFPVRLATGGPPPENDPGRSRFSTSKTAQSFWPIRRQSSKGLRRHC